MPVFQERWVYRSNTDGSTGETTQVLISTSDAWSKRAFFQTEQFSKNGCSHLHVCDRKSFRNISAKRRFLQYEREFRVFVQIGFSIQLFHPLLTTYEISNAAYVENSEFQRRKLSTSVNEISFSSYCPEREDESESFVSLNPNDVSPCNAFVYVYEKSTLTYLGCCYYTCNERTPCVYRTPTTLSVQMETFYIPSPPSPPPPKPPSRPLHRFPRPLRQFPFKRSSSLSPLLYSWSHS